MTYNIKIRVEKLESVKALLTECLTECKFEMGEITEVPYASGEGNYKVQEIKCTSSDWQEVHRTLVKGGMLRLFHQGITEYI